MSCNLTLRFIFYIHLPDVHDHYYYVIRVIDSGGIERACYSLQIYSTMGADYTSTLFWGLTSPGRES